MAAEPLRLLLDKWRDTIQAIEPLEDVTLDEEILKTIILEHQLVSPPKQIKLHIPSFKQIETSEYNSCAQSPWPAISITGAECKLMCDHCQAEILKPMINASTPDSLWQIVTAQIERGAKGMLLSGGSNHRNEVQFDNYYAIIEKIKKIYPWFQIAVHAGLATKAQADSLKSSGVDIAMMDVIGAQETITHVYHLKRTVTDFAQSLENLINSGMKVVPHIVMGLHYGEFLGEYNALDIVAAHDVDALVVVAAMPQYAKPGKIFKIPDVKTIARFFIQVRKQLAQKTIILGCARPGGHARSQIDAYAVLVGLNGIAHPADGIIQLAKDIGLITQIETGCCTVNTISELELLSDSHRAVQALHKIKVTQS